MDPMGNWIIYWMFITASRWIIRMDPRPGQGLKRCSALLGETARATAAGAHAAQLPATQLSQAWGLPPGKRLHSELENGHL